MPRKTPLDAFHWHEALDRAVIASAVFDEFLLDHPAVQQTPALRKLATRLSDGLGEFYQAVGRADPSIAGQTSARLGKGHRSKSRAG